jgi:hypothetical protein
MPALHRKNEYCIKRHATRTGLNRVLSGFHALSDYPIDKSCPQCMLWLSTVSELWFLIYFENSSIHLLTTF